MASGFGVRGRTGRCYLFWRDFSNCMTTTASPKNCLQLRADYSECLHHKGEFDRLNKIHSEEGAHRIKMVSNVAVK